LRLEFVSLARAPGANLAELCRRYGISRKSGYKWLARVRGAADLGAALADRSRRPQRSPHRTQAGLEERLAALRAEHPAWGPRKLRRRLEDLGVAQLPAPST